ncbi:MAG TPA: 4Fe-4S binding protein [Methanothrix sp.]|nr:4Fe-4S binding protein [Methanothrix sp.]
MAVDIEKEMEVEGSIIRSIQRSEESEKILDYDYKKCVGCGICVDLCPTKALSLGPVVEIATGLDAPPVLIDLDKCVFCGMCAAFCPVDALRMTRDGKDYRELEEYPRLLSRAEPNERCLPCALCEPVCPTEAITVVFYPTRDVLGPLREEERGEGKGKIEVDPEKCNLCGRCARFCPAFLLQEKEPTPTDLKPFEQLLVDEELCDHCGLCVGICPEEAIKVEGKALKLEEEFEFSGEIEVDQEKCIGCGRCLLVCPYQAMDITKPFEGDIRLVDRQLRLCDPMGCHACFNVCPADCWHVGEDGKVRVEKGQCILCGACAKACHCLAIEVDRTGVSTTRVLETPWAQEWKEAISSIVSRSRRRQDLSGIVLPPEIEKVPIPEVEAPERDAELLNKINRALADVEAVINKPKVRFVWERDEIEEAGEKITERIKKAKAKAAAEAEGGEEG